jgi:pimeloyl-ACP methyl ester carboxylesterase
VVGVFTTFTVASQTPGLSKTGFIHRPSSPAAGNPWVLYTLTLLPSPPSGIERSFYFAQFLDAGIAVAGVDAGEFYGAPVGLSAYSLLYAAMTAAGFSLTPLLFARSRGGLNAFNWAAENSGKVSGVACIYPAVDLASYPGIAPPNTEMQASWGMATEAEFEAALPTINPVNRLAPLAAAGVPLYSVHGDADVVVPIEENSQLVKTRYDALGGTMTLQIAPGEGHDFAPAIFNSNQDLADFVIENSV